MGTDLESRLLALKREVEEAKQVAAQAEGRLQSVMDRLRTEYDCDSVEAAEALADRLEVEAAELEQELNATLTKLETAWESLK